MSIPFLSVILPTYNRVHCIARMIDSVLSQSFKDFELIVVDDGSTDGTREMLEQKYDDSRIQIVYKENGGVSSARNLGISLARGKYITFVDSDDYLLDGFFEDIYENILQYGADIYVYAGFSQEKTKLIGVPLFWGNQGYGNGEIALKSGSEFVRDFCLYGGNSWACAKIFKTSLIRENNLVFQENISYGEDMLFNLQTYLASLRIVAIPRGYYVYEVSGNGLSRRCLSSHSKVLDLLRAYQMLEKYSGYETYFAINYIRHARRWLISGFLSLDSITKQEFQKLYTYVHSPYCRIEAIEALIAKKNLLCALIVYKFLSILKKWRFYFHSVLFYMKSSTKLMLKYLKNI